MSLKSALKMLFKRTDRNYWKDGALALIMFQIIGGYPGLVFINLMQVGLTTPEAEVPFNNVSMALVGPLESMFKAGQGVALDNPFVARILNLGLSAFMWSVFISLSYFSFQLIKEGLWFVGLKYKARSKRG